MQYFCDDLFFAIIVISQKINHPEIVLVFNALIIFVDTTNFCSF